MSLSSNGVSRRQIDNLKKPVLSWKQTINRRPTSLRRWQPILHILLPILPTSIAQLFIHSFIQSAISIAPLQVLYYSEALSTTVHGVSRRSAQATAGKGLVQGPYVAARAGVETTTLRLKVIASTKAPPRPSYSAWLTIYLNGYHSIFFAAVLPKRNSS